MAKIVCFANWKTTSCYEMMSNKVKQSRVKTPLFINNEMMSVPVGKSRG